VRSARSDEPADPEEIEPLLALGFLGRKWIGGEVPQSSRGRLEELSHLAGSLAKEVEEGREGLDTRTGASEVQQAK
jgi:hypothetical protein